MPSTAFPLARMERGQLLQLERALTREWLLTDGAGGYAASTVLGCNTRRYHGLLVAPYPGNPKRHVFLSRVEDSLRPLSPEPPPARAGRSPEAPEGGFALSMARYGGAFAPAGHAHQEGFELLPYPSFLYRIGGLSVRREVLLARGEATVLVRWALSGDAPEVELAVRPLFACREADALTFENGALDPRVERTGAALAFRPYAPLPAVHLALDGAPWRFDPRPQWYRGIEYRLDLERGYDGREDGFSPGCFAVRLRPGGECILAASIARPVTDARAAWARESAARRDHLEELLSRSDDPRAARRFAQLDLAADDFLVQVPLRSPTGETRTRLGVIAGFPWFGEWGRDTFVSLPGLLLARGRVAECGQALVDASAYLEEGLLPNVFGAGIEDSQYGSADAALWFARAVSLYDRAGGDERLVLGPLRSSLATIAEHYGKGKGEEGPRAAALGLHCDEAGLIAAGGPGLNPTWMDAITSRGAVTPRDGCAVEINALWYQLLAVLEDLDRRAGDSLRSREWRRRRRLAGAAFLRRFWIEEQGSLADAWKDGRRDESVRPNMVIAAALEHSPLSEVRRGDVVRRAELELLTARGLRTLSPRHPAYRGTYAGGPEARDEAYHQGSVWPWLLGSYVEASLRASGLRRPRAKGLARLLEGFDEHLSTQGLNHVSEVFDGDPPHRPGGTFAQAWNTAELLRAWRLLEDLRP